MTEDASAQLGDCLRYARKARRMTLKALADAVGCSESLLSKVERGRVTPTLPMLHKCAQTLGVSIASLFSATSAGSAVVYNQGERPILELGVGDKPPKVKLERMIPYVDGRILDANLHVVPPGGGSSGVYSHNGEEVGYVVSGYIELTIDSKTTVLSEGSSFFFRSELPHSYRNVGATDALLVWVNAASG